jgi:hypothetical protein
MKIGRPKTTGNCETRDELERGIRFAYRTTTDSLRRIADVYGVSVATAWRIVASDYSTSRLTSA